MQNWYPKKVFALQHDISRQPTTIHNRTCAYAGSCADDGQIGAKRIDLAFRGFQSFQGRTWSVFMKCRCRQSRELVAFESGVCEWCISKQSICPRGTSPCRVIASA